MFTDILFVIIYVNMIKLNNKMFNKFVLFCYLEVKIREWNVWFYSLIFCSFKEYIKEFVFLEINF